MLRLLSFLAVALVSSGVTYLVMQSSAVEAADPVAQTPGTSVAAAEPSEPAEPLSDDFDPTYLYQTYPGIERGSLRPSEADGLVEVRQGSAYGYVTDDGRYMVQGDLIDLASGTSLTERRRDETRREVIASLGEDQMIVFSPPDGEVKHVINIFTDTTCGYCQKLHNELDQYFAQGIEIRYLMYPRSGPKSPSFQTAESIWCADDRQQALTRAKARQTIEQKSCENPIMDHYRAGQAAGLRGTPMMVTEQGTVISGYLPAPALAARLSASEEG